MIFPNAHDFASTIGPARGTTAQHGTFARWVVRTGGSFLKFQGRRGVDTGGGGRGSREKEDRGEGGYENRRKKEKERTRGEEGEVKDRG